MLNLSQFLFLKSRRAPENPLGAEALFELLETEGAQGYDREELAAVDETNALFLDNLPLTISAEDITFNEPYSDVLFVEAEVLSEALDSGVPGPAFAWNEPRDWFGPLRQAARSDWRLFQERVAAVQTRLQRTGRQVVDAVVWGIELPGQTAAWIQRAPGRVQRWFVTRPWNYLLSVRRGFLFGAISGFSIVGSTMWAISSVPYLTGHLFEPTSVMPAYNIPIARGHVPSQLGWFFIQFPYVSEKAQIKPKNFHTYVITDPARKRDYVVILGQRYRRVEIYGKDGVDGQQVQVFTPGYKKTVWFQGTRMMGETKSTDGNLWMWNGPLWNDMHVKIYGLADLWIDSPYKRYSCAGFVHKFLSDAGVHVPIKDAWDLAKEPWTRIPLEEMEPGDIITIRAASAEHRRFWHHSVTHVGVYIGHGKMIHAATSLKSPRAWVRIADVEDFHGRIDKVLRPPELL